MTTTVGPPTPERTRVLVVDDTATNLRLMHVMLRGMDVEVLSAASGAEAIKLVEAYEFAVILLDVRMDEMDGYETATRIREVEKGRLRLTPIIFVTAEYQAEVQVHRGYSVGAVDYLLKPIVREILVAKVQFFVELFDTKRRLQEQTEQEYRHASLRRDLQIAKDIQHSILPHVGEYSGVEVFASLQSAQEVGGDFYDLVTCHIGHDRRLCAVVGDVVGKGIPAAMVMVMTLTVLREATRINGSPAEILTRANHILHGRLKALDTSNAVTASCISIDAANRTLYHSRAGHEFALLWSRDRGVEKLVCKGPILGAFSEPKFEEVSIPLQHGDKVILHTDGISEARNAEREFYTQERLADLIQQHGTLPPRDLGNLILAEVAAFQGDRVRDDIALLIVELT